MPEQENLEKGALALEALQEISGGLSAAGIKKGAKSAGESIKKGFGVLANYAKENPGKAAALVTTLVGIEELARNEYKHGGKFIRHTLASDPVENFKDWLKHTEYHEKVRPTGYHPIHLDDTFPDQAGDY